MFNVSKFQTGSFLNQVLGITFTIEMLGAILIYFSLDSGLEQRVFYSIFHSVSAFCNAGFSLLGSGVQPVDFGYLGVISIASLIILGGLGFPIYIELISLIIRKQLKWNFLKPSTKLTLIVMWSCLLIGSLLFYFFDQVRPITDLNPFERAFQSLFYSISSRTAGFNMLSLDQFHLSTLVVILILMIIGANSSSTGGGIKTTTLGVLIVTVMASLKNKKQVIFDYRAINSTTIFKSISILFIYLFVASLGIVTLILTENLPPFALAFESISALSTVGLSLGVTAELSNFGKIINMFLMIFGRIGLLTIVFAGLGESQSSKLKYTEDEFTVG